VPKSQRLQLSAINKAELDSGDEGVQMLKVTAVSGVS
jgi:AP-1 complex subunit gamma-1